MGRLEVDKCAIDDILIRCERLSVIDAELLRLRAEVAEIRKLEKDREETVRGMLETLRQCDVTATGNTGWEHRITTLLPSLIQAAKS